MKAPLQAPVQRDQARRLDAVSRMPDRQTTRDVGFVDNRPAAVAQRKLQEFVNNSPRVLQHKAFADMLNSSPQVMQQKAQMGAIQNSHPMVMPPQQRDELFAGAVHQQAHEASREQRIREQAEEPLQAKFSSEAPKQLAHAPAEKPNNTGLPDQLKSGIESMSGMSMDYVRVHYNSSKPAQLNAHAYAQGSDIHLASGQEKHLPHEAWHVVQQAQGRVRPTMHLNGGVGVNDDAGLEREADAMGAAALQTKSMPLQAKEKYIHNSSFGILQRVVYEKGARKSIADLKEAYPGNELDEYKDRFESDREYDLEIMELPSAAAAARKNYKFTFKERSVGSGMPSAKTEGSPVAEEKDEVSEVKKDKNNEITASIRKYTEQMYQIINPYNRLEDKKKFGELLTKALMSQDGRASAANFILGTLGVEDKSDPISKSMGLIKEGKNLKKLKNAIDKLSVNIDAGIEEKSGGNYGVKCLSRGERDLGGVKSTFYGKLEKGKKIKFASHTSFSIGEEPLIKVAYTNLYQIRNIDSIKKGLFLNAHELSAHEGENEVLFKRGAEFEVVSVKPGKINKIELK